MLELEVEHLPEKKSLVWPPADLSIYIRLSASKDSATLSVVVTGKSMYLDSPALITACRPYEHLMADMKDVRTSSISMIFRVAARLSII